MNQIEFLSVYYTDNIILNSSYASFQKHKFDRDSTTQNRYDITRALKILNSGSLQQKSRTRETEKKRVSKLFSTLGSLSKRKKEKTFCQKNRSNFSKKNFFHLSVMKPVVDVIKLCSGNLDFPKIKELNKVCSDSSTWLKMQKNPSKTVQNCPKLFKTVQNCQLHLKWPFLFVSIKGEIKIFKISSKKCFITFNTEEREREREGERESASFVQD